MSLSLLGDVFESDLPPLDRLVALVVADFSGRVPCIETLRARTGLDDEDIHSILGRLTVQGWIDRLREDQEVAGRASDVDVCRRHNERARSLGQRADLTIQQWLENLAVFGRKCAYCGGPYEVLEHVEPVRVAGTTVTNCVPACRACNHAKGAKESSELLGEIALHVISVKETLKSLSPENKE